jgi:hypothetical protein
LTTADDFEFINGKRAVKAATPSILKELYTQQLQHAGYRALLERNVTILGALDDHDYGTNNGDAEFQYRTESGVEYVDFLKETNKADLTLMADRAASGKGVYGVKVFDFSRPAGEELLTDTEAGLDPDLVKSRPVDDINDDSLPDRSVAVFVLDNRSHKTPWRKGWPNKYTLDYEADFFGETQWQWFEEAIARSTASVNIIVQGLQVHADRYFDGNEVEDWSRFPMAQHRMYQAALQAGVQAPIFVSGDVHMAELLRKDCKRTDSDDDDTDDGTTPIRSLLEVTTSGMTHSWGTHVCARPDSSLSCRVPYLDKSLAAGMHLAHINHAWTDVVDIGKERHEGAKSRYQYSLELNFAEFEFDWDQRQVIIRIRGTDVEAGPYLSTRWDFDALSGKTALEETGKILPRHYDSIWHQLSTHGAKRSDWICVNYRGKASVPLKVFGVVGPMSFALFWMSLPVVLPLVLMYILMRPKSKKV